MPQFEIRPFNPVEAETITHWAEDIEDVWRLTGSRDEPLTAGRIIAWNWETNYCFTLRYRGDLVAYAEVLEDEVDNDVEIQHLLVAPDFRGKGMGRAMLDRICAFITAARPYPEVWMRVGRDNEPGARCAAAAGFAIDELLSGPRYAWHKRKLAPEAKDFASAK